LPRSESAFVAQNQRAKNRLPEVASALACLLQQLGVEYQTLMGRLATIRIQRIKNELNDQLDHLIHPGFLSNTPWNRLQQFPRYLKGMTLRLEKFANNPERDANNSLEVNALWQQYLHRLEKHQKIGLIDVNLDEFRWQIEELRVSLFAQELKTPCPVSIKRLLKLWESVRP
jgi:ATP-dependent helicase HrpA